MGGRLLNLKNLKIPASYFDPYNFTNFGVALSVRGSLEQMYLGDVSTCSHFHPPPAYFEPPIISFGNFLDPSLMMMIPPPFIVGFRVTI